MASQPRKQDYASLRELCTDEDLPGWSVFWETDAVGHDSGNSFLTVAWKKTCKFKSHVSRMY